MSPSDNQNSNRLTSRHRIGAHVVTLVFIGLCLVLAGCSSVPVVGASSGNVDIDAHFVATSSTRTAIIHAAAAELGAPYRRDASGPQAFDDNGLVQYAYAKANIKLPLAPHGLLGAGEPVTLAAAQPADLVFFQTKVAGGANSLRVGLLLNSGEMLYASARAGKVVIQSIDTDYWQSRLLGAVRILP